MRKRVVCIRAVALLTATCAFAATSIEDASITIPGDADFIDRTTAALALLEELAPDAFLKASTFVGVIAQGERSGMWAFEEPPRYEVADETSTYSVTWYASTIAHDATHSELYHRYLSLHPDEDVPAEVWTGVSAEIFCLSYQLEVLKAIGGPQHEVDYLAKQTGTHCDVDGDGDCDWDDYENRDW